MDKALFIIFFIVGVGTVLYFTPFLVGGLGFKVNNNIIREPANIFYSFDGGKTIREGEVRVGVFGRPNPEITSFAFDPSDAEIVYAGTRGGGMVMSDDGGRSWYGFSDPKQVIASNDIVEDVFVPAPDRIVVVIHKAGTYVVYETMNSMKTVHELARFKEKDTSSLETFLVSGLELRRENVSIAKTPERMQLALAAVIQTSGDTLTSTFGEMGISMGVVAIDPLNRSHIIIGRSK
ncbi:MAG: hypothetical protein HZA35_01005 [Parcubacteria group bacterium]|nr:hypothetical protein [Parcubacteria group bacterium]